MIGRPKTPDDRKAVEISIEKRHLDMLDAHIRDTLFREGAVGVSPKAIAKARRGFLGDLIESNLSFEDKHPTKLKIIAPVALFVAPDEEPEERLKDVDEATSWMRDNEERLTREAPDIIQAGLSANKLKRLQRDDPAEYHRVLGEIVNRLDDTSD